METKEAPISQLYYNYKNVSDEKLVSILENVKIVSKIHKGEGTVFGYYPLSDSSMERLKEKLRRVSLTFDIIETVDDPLLGLVEYKTIQFLCKSSSRFFLKPDIGEVIDQIHFMDIIDDKPKFDAIHIKKGYKTLPGTQDEHHVMEAVLLKQQ